MSLAPLPEDWDTALAVVAHPDDMEYGAASAVARWTGQGKAVAYGSSRAARPASTRSRRKSAHVCAKPRSAPSAAVVGVTSVEFLGHADGVIEYGLPLRRDITAAIRRHRPELVVTLNHRDSWGGHSLNMADHRNTGAAVLDAVRDAANRWVFADAGEPWTGVRSLPERVRRNRPMQSM